MKNATIALTVCVLMLFSLTGFAKEIYNPEILEKVERAIANGEEITSEMKAESEKMMEIYTRQYYESHGELDRTGGPDDAGYIFYDSEEDGCPDYEWIDLANSEDATQITGWGDDTASGPLDIGFDFSFYGVDKTTCYGTSNGLFGFNSASMTAYSNVNAPSTNAPNDLIMPWWDDMHGGYGGTFVYYETIEWEDGRDAFVFEVNGLTTLGGGNNINTSVSYEVILFGDGEIRLQYNHLGVSLRRATCTIGIENSSGTVGLSYGFNSQDNEPPEEEWVIVFAQPALLEGVAVNGTVTNAMNGLPLAGVMVEIAGGFAETDEDGEFSFDCTDAREGTPMSVVASGAEGYNTYSGSVILEEGENEVNIEMTQLPFWFEMYSCDFEDDDGGWVGTGEWEWSGGEGVGALYYYYGPPHSGDYVWVTDTDDRTGPYLAPNGQTMTSGDSYLLPEAGAYFSYWFSMYDYYYYGGHQAQISTDFGDSWEQIVPDGGYPYDGSYSTYNQWDAGQGYFGGYLYQQFQYAHFDLTDYVGEEVMFRIEQRCYSSSYYGPAIDDVAFPIQAMQLTGQVTDSETGDPIAGAYVRTWETEMDDQLYTVITDEEGMYSAPIYPGEFDLEIWHPAYWHMWVEGVEVGDEGGEQDIEMVVIAENTMEEIQMNLEVGDFTIATGIVTQPSNSTTSEWCEFYVQDESGYGLMIYNDAPMEVEFNRGDSLWLRGSIDEISGMRKLVDWEYEVISVDNDVPEAMWGTTGELRDMDDMEGAWVGMLTQLQQDPVEDGSYSLQMNDGSGQVEVRIWENTCINLRLYEEGEWLHLEGVVSIFEGHVRIVPSMQSDIWTTPVYAPEELVGAITVNEESEIPEEWFADVDLEWSHEAPPEPEAEELCYDDDDPEEAIAEVGTVYGVQFTADENRGGQLLELRYYTILNEGENTFTAGIYGWDDGAGAPEDEGMMYPGVVAEDEAWTSLDITAENLFFRAGEEWVIAFGSDFETVMLGHDTESDEGRSYRGTDRGWFEDDGAYFVRALVIYETGEQALIGPDNNELDEFIEFVVYRDGEELVRTAEMTYSDHIEVPMGGDGLYSWEYSVTAVFEEGETDPSNVLAVEWNLNGVAIREFDGIPVEWDIAAAYPNPFNPMVNVVVAVPKLAGVKAEIVNVLGRRVALLQDGKLQPGYHKMHWNATSYPSGLYFMRVTSSTGFNQIQKLMYVK